MIDLNKKAPKRTAPKNNGWHSISSVKQKDKNQIFDGEREICFKSIF